MTTQEVATKLVGFCREGQFENAMKELYSPMIVSVEPEGAPVKEVRGIEAVVEKSKGFNEMVESYHGMEGSDPVGSENSFSCAMKMDVTLKGAPRMVMEEVCLYQVKDGKIVREEFFYTPENA